MPLFSIVTQEQGTESWREWRHNGIGASDAAAILGENRFSSITELMLEKCSPPRDDKQSVAMAVGTRLEPRARQLYVAKTGLEMRPACLQSNRLDWLRASLDGLTLSNDAAVEIKCGKSAYRSTYQTRAVPNRYYGQLQHILAVTGFDSIDYWCYWPGCAPILITVPRNESYIQRLLVAEAEFWEEVQQKRQTRIER